MFAIKVEYEGESVDVALYEGIQIEEFLEVITSSLHVNGTIIGLRDSNGVILLPKFVCHNCSSLQQSSYELIVKSKDNNRTLSSAVSRKVEPNRTATMERDRGSNISTPIEPVSSQMPKKPGDMQIEQEISQLVKYLKMDGFLSEQEEHCLLELIRTENADLITLYRQYCQYLFFFTL